MNNDTLEERMNKAIKTIRQQGIVAKRNVKGCCRSCIDFNLAENVPIIWSYGGQGKAVYIEGDYATDNKMYFNHANLFDEVAELNDAGKRVMATFEMFGISASIESPHRCLIVSIPDSLRYEV